MLSLKDFSTALPEEERKAVASRYNEEEILNAVKVIQNTENNKESNIAMSRLIKQYYAYILKTAYAMDSSGVDDKIIAGCEGLLFAARNFDLESGNKFMTYAYKCIYGYMGIDSREGRLVKITSTSMKKLKAEGNEVKLANATMPMSLNVAIDKSVCSDDADDEESLLTDGIDYAQKVVEGEYAAKTHDLMKEIIMEDTTEVAPGVTYGDIFCHIYELFGYSPMKLKEAAQYFNLNEQTLKSKCRRIRSHIMKSNRLRKYLEMDELVRKQKEIKAPVMVSCIGPYSLDEFGQMYFTFE